MDSSPHLFAVGQTVRLRNGFAHRLQASGVFRITRTLPPHGEFPQYQIRSDDERHERLAAQNELEAVTSSAHNRDAALVERTFGAVRS
jgi:hypothetical protein